MLSNARRSWRATAMVLAVTVVAAIASVLLLRMPLDAARTEATVLRETLPVSAEDLGDAQTVSRPGPALLNLDQEIGRAADRALWVGPLALLAVAATAIAMIWRTAGTATTAQTRTDPLTGVATRPVLHDRLRHAVANAERNASQVALLFVDFDDFKRLNDDHDHDAGDRVLIEIADRLQAAARRTDLVVRWGGDEFVLLLENLDDSEGAAIAADKLLAAVREPISLGGVRVSTTASIGLAMYPEASRDPVDLIRMADAAMYAAKAAGGNTYRFSTPELRSDSERRQSTLIALREAVDAGDLSLRYQPQVDLRSGRVCGAEALLRWQRNGQEAPPVPAGQFIMLTETTDLAEPLGRWVLDQALEQVVTWDRTGREGLRVSVNVSARHLVSTLCEDVPKALAKHGVEAERLEIEVAERAVLDDPERSEPQLARLQQLGVTVVLDNFGTGLTSLARLGELPIDGLKLDPTMAHHLAGRGSAIVAGIVGLARELGLAVIVPHVEHTGQLRRARELGCHRAQGFLVAPPLLAGEVAQTEEAAVTLSD